MEVIVFLFLFVCGFLCAFISGFKRRNTFLFFMVGMLLGPIGVIACLVVPKNEEEIEKEKVKFGSHKKCPKCAEIVKKEAVICKHCGSKFQLSSQLKTITSEADPDNSSKRIGQCQCGQRFGFNVSELGKKITCPECENQMILG